MDRVRPIWSSPLTSEATLRVDIHAHPTQRCRLIWCSPNPLLAVFPPSFSPFTLWRPALYIKTLHGWVSQQITTTNKWENDLLFYMPPDCYFLPSVSLLYPKPSYPPLVYFPRLLNKHDLSRSSALLHLVRASLLMLDWPCPSTQGSPTRCTIPANTHQTDTAVGLTFECLQRIPVIFAPNKIMPTRRICCWHLPFVKMRRQWGFMSH